MCCPVIQTRSSASESALGRRLRSGLGMSFYLVPTNATLQMASTRPKWGLTWDSQQHKRRYYHLPNHRQPVPPLPLAYFQQCAIMAPANVIRICSRVPQNVPGLTGVSCSTCLCTAWQGTMHGPWTADKLACASSQHRRMPVARTGAPCAPGSHSQ